MLITSAHCGRYYLTDGTPVGNGYTSNTSPYAHWAYNFADTLAATPTKTCTYANSAYKYDQVGQPSQPDHSNGSWAHSWCQIGMTGTAMYSSLLQEY